MYSRWPSATMLALKSGPFRRVPQWQARRKTMRPIVRLIVIALFSAVPVLAASPSDKVSGQLLASVHPALVWQRTSPSNGFTEGPILYQLIFRSSATPGNLPMISPRFTLTNSLLSQDTNGVHIGGLTILPTGFITLCCGQSFGSGSGGAGTVASIAAGTGLSFSPNPITTTGTIGIANGGVTNLQIGTGSASSGQVLTADGSGGAAWQTVSTTGGGGGSVQTAVVQACTSGGSPSTPCATSVTWPIPFADSNYAATCTLESGQTNVGFVTNFSKSASGLTVEIVNSVEGAFVDCIGIAGNGGSNQTSLTGTWLGTNSGGSGGQGGNISANLNENGIVITGTMQIATCYNHTFTIQPGSGTFVNGVINMVIADNFISPAETPARVAFQGNASASGLILSGSYSQQAGNSCGFNLIGPGTWSMTKQ
jgi:hypothetical protein